MIVGSLKESNLREGSSPPRSDFLQGQYTSDKDTGNKPVCLSKNEDDSKKQSPSLLAAGDAGVNQNSLTTPSITISKEAKREEQKAE